MKIFNLQFSIPNLFARARLSLFRNSAQARQREQSDPRTRGYARFGTRPAERAFTLIEAMVSISILSLAITGPIIIAQKSVGSAVYARDQITAFYLAQEAVEYVRNIRDSNRITGTSWLSQLSACMDTGSAQKCAIDARYTDFNNSGAIVSCPSGVCPVLSFDTTNGVYGYGSGANWKTTPFTRTVSIDNRASSKEAALSVTVSWTTSLFAPVKTFTIKEYMFNF